MNLILILSESERSVKLAEIKFANIKNTNTAKLLIATLIHIPKGQKGIALMILLYSNAHLVPLAELERAHSGPDTLELKVVFELHVEVAALVFAQFDVLFDVPEAVHAGLEVEAFVGELDFDFVRAAEGGGELSLGFVV